MKGAREERHVRGAGVSPCVQFFFLAPILHAIQSNNLVIVDHFKVYVFPVLKAIKYSCNINFTFSALKVAIVKLRAQYGNQHISLLASSLFMVRIRATERRRFAGWKWKFMRDRCKLSLSFPAPRTLPWVPETFLERARFLSSLSRHFGLPGYSYSCLLLRAGLSWPLATPPNNGELVRRLHGLELISSKWF